MRPARPTLRCLREDLELPLPPVTVPLDEIEHPILAKAAEQFADVETKHWGSPRTESGGGSAPSMIRCCSK